MVFGFVKQSGGHMPVDSEPGRGTTFHLYFPCDKIGTAAAALPGADPNEVAGGSESVLLAEDDPLVRHVAERQLSDLGYMVTVSEDAAAALAILASERQFDLLFTDVVMPGGMDGVDLAEHAAKMRPELKVLLTSGFVAAGKDGKRNGPLPFPLLNKPYERHELARAVRDALDRGKAPDTSAATGGDAKPERPVG
jgi:CheY-like chemotaxis protein